MSSFTTTSTVTIACAAACATVSTTLSTVAGIAVGNTAKVFVLRKIVKHFEHSLVWVEATWALGGEGICSSTLKRGYCESARGEFRDHAATEACLYKVSNTVSFVRNRLPEKTKSSYRQAKFSASTVSGLQTFSSRRAKSLVDSALQ
jgi:hypothetical protein